MHQTIDWFSWLSKTGLEDSLIYEYGLAFTHNELEEDDLAYFNHEFLQSMGISIAKHRLEILKVAKRKKGSMGSNPVTKMVRAIKRTKRSLVSYVRTWVHRDDEDSALVLVKTRSHGLRWKGSLLKRNKRLALPKQGTTTLLLTNGYHPMVKSGGGAGEPVVYGLLPCDPAKTDGGDRRSYGGDEEEEEEDDSGGYWSGSCVEEIKWDTMFQNLKPT